MKFPTCLAKKSFKIRSKNNPKYITFITKNITKYYSVIVNLKKL